MVLADRFAVLLTIKPTPIDISATTPNNCFIVNLALLYPAKAIKFTASERTRVNVCLRQLSRTSEVVAATVSY